MASRALYINVAGSMAAEVCDDVRKECVSDSVGSVSPFSFPAAQTLPESP